MPATELDAMAFSAGSYPATFAPSAGSNRIAFVACIRASGTNATPETSATLGGQTMSVLATVDDNANTLDVAITVFYLLESGISAMSGSTFTPTGGSGGSFSAITWSVKDAKQEAPALNSSTSTGTTSVSLSLARVADSMTYAIAAHDISSTTTWSGLANPSEDGENGTTNMDVAWGSEADTARTASFTATAGSTRENASIVINVAPAPPGGLSITSVTPSSFDDGRTGIVIAGSGFGASQGSSTLTIGGQAQTVTAWSDTSITFTSVRGSNSMGARSLTLTRA